MTSPETPPEPKKASAVLEKMFAPLVDRVLDRVMPTVEAKLEDFKNEALKILAAQVPILLDRLMAIVPLAVATAVEEALKNVANRALGGDPDIPGVSSVFDLSETIRQGLNDSHPDVNIPTITDALKNVGGEIIGNIFGR